MANTLFFAPSKSRTAACGNQKALAHLFQQKQLPIASSKGDLISLATEKEAREAEQLIDTFLTRTS